MPCPVVPLLVDPPPSPAVVLPPPQVGTGCQIICTSVVTLMLATLGFLSPASRGALLTTTIVLYVWLAVVAGFTSVYMWGVMERTYNGWPAVCASVSVYFPGIVMTIFTILNMAIHHTGARAHACVRLAGWGWVRVCVCVTECPCVTD